MSLRNVSEADCEQLDRAVAQAVPDENGFRTPGRTVNGGIQFEF